MVYEFEIVMTRWHHNRGDFIFARHLGDRHDMDIPKGSIFGDIAIYNYTEARPLHGKDDNPDFSLFVFRPISLQRLPESYFKEGQHVKLTIE